MTPKSSDSHKGKRSSQIGRQGRHKEKVKVVVGGASCSAVARA
jgi:hypothetical protein